MRRFMSLLGNIIWLICGGFLSGLGYILGGIVTCLTIVGIPFGWPTIKIGFATMAPFGKENVVTDSSSGLLRMIFNVLWLVFFGWEIALAHLAHAGILAITVVGIPFAVQHMKLIPMALFPFGRELRKK